MLKFKVDLTEGGCLYVEGESLKEALDGGNLFPEEVRDINQVAFKCENCQTPIMKANIYEDATLGVQYALCDKCNTKSVHRSIDCGTERYMYGDN